MVIYLGKGEHEWADEGKLHLSKGARWVLVQEDTLDHLQGKERMSMYPMDSAGLTRHRLDRTARE